MTHWVNHKGRPKMVLSTDETGRMLLHDGSETKQAAIDRDMTEAYESLKNDTGKIVAWIRDNPVSLWRDERVGRRIYYCKAGEVVRMGENPVMLLWYSVQAFTACYDGWDNDVLVVTTMNYLDEMVCRGFGSDVELDRFEGCYRAKVWCRGKLKGIGKNESPVFALLEAFTKIR